MSLQSFFCLIVFKKCCQYCNKCNTFDWQFYSYPIINIYTSISIASISFTGRMKFIPRWTSLALSPRKGTENTNDVRKSPLFLQCCYFKIASTRCKAILIASLNKLRISQYRFRLLLFTRFYSVYVQFNQKSLLKSINRLKKGHNRRITKFLVLCVALWRHSTLTESKHDAAFLTNS